MFGKKPVRVKETALSISIVLIGLVSLVTSIQVWGIAVSIAGTILGILCLRKYGSSTGAICGTALCVISLCMGLMFVVTSWMMENDPAFRASMQQQIEEQFHVDVEVEEDAADKDAEGAGQ